jgi:hypothetical protein
LASERLAALGGRPDGAIAYVDKVVLRPPPPAAAPADTTRSFRVATEATKELDGTIVLRGSRSKEGGIAALPPGTAPRVTADRPAPRISASPARKPPARSIGGLILRPALDQHDWAPIKDAAAVVQLGAWRSEVEANAGWDKARAKAGKLLDGLIPHVVTADLPGMVRYYRLRVSPASGQSRAGLCASLVAKGLTCLPVRE